MVFHLLELTRNTKQPLLNQSWRPPQVRNLRMADLPCLRRNEALYFFQTGSMITYIGPKFRNGSVNGAGFLHKVSWDAPLIANSCYNALIFQKNPLDRKISAYIQLSPELKPSLREIRPNSCIRAVISQVESVKHRYNCIFALISWVCAAIT